MIVIGRFRADRQRRKQIESRLHLVLLKAKPLLARCCRSLALDRSGQRSPRLCSPVLGSSKSRVGVFLRCDKFQCVQPSLRARAATSPAAFRGRRAGSEPEQSATIKSRLRNVSRVSRSRFASSSTPATHYIITRSKVPRDYGEIRPARLSSRVRSTISLRPADVRVA